MQLNKIFSNIIRLATALAFLVVVLGAYVRLSDAGLGCPDWPGCYGQLIVPLDAQEAQSLEHDYKERPLEHDKAWKEMVHRYAAGTLGLLILLLVLAAWKNRAKPGQPVITSGILLVLVIFQALLGMWTVTLLLKPVIVMGHLLGGMLILSLLFWLMLRLSHGIGHPAPASRSLLPWALSGIVVVAVQISLGGWTSANYAALVCPDFPMCQGSWWPPMDFAEGFRLWRGLGIDYEGGVLGADARTAIHVSHRLGALLSLLVITAVALRAIRDNNRQVSKTGIALLLLLLIQIGLGITNVVQLLPLPVAVAHNGVAALLLLCLVTLLNYSVPNKTNDGHSIG